MYIYTDICLCVYIYINIYISIYRDRWTPYCGHERQTRCAPRVHKYICVPIYVYLYLYVSVCIYIYIYLYLSRPLDTILGTRTPAVVRTSYI